MTEAGFLRLVAEGQGPYPELKRPGRKPAALAHTLVAFANTGGGRVLIGIDDAVSRNILDAREFEGRAPDLIDQARNS